MHGRDVSHLFRNFILDRCRRMERLQSSFPTEVLSQLQGSEETHKQIQGRVGNFHDLTDLETSSNAARKDLKSS